MVYIFSGIGLEATTPPEPQTPDAQLWVTDNIILRHSVKKRAVLISLRSYFKPANGFMVQLHSSTFGQGKN